MTKKLIAEATAAALEEDEISGREEVVITSMDVRMKEEMELEKFENNEGKLEIDLAGVLTEKQEEEARARASLIRAQKQVDASTNIECIARAKLEKLTR